MTVNSNVADTSTLPLNTPVVLQNGLYVERRNDFLVVYNSAPTPVLLPLSKLNYLPPMEAMSAKRAAAAPYIVSMTQALWDHSIYIYFEGGAPNCEIGPPNKATCGVPEHSRVYDENGRFTNDGRSGVQAYKSNAAYRNAVDYAVWLQMLKQRRDFRRNCLLQVNGMFNDRSLGAGANIEQLACFQRNKQAPVYTENLFIGDNLIVKTYDTLMQEKATRERMTKEAQLASAWSDGTAYLPVVGTLENGAKCVGLNTSIVQAIYYGIRERYLGQNFRDAAVLAGWKPEAPNSSSIASTALDCLGAVPLVGPASKGAKTASTLTHAEALREAAGRSAQLFETVQSAALSKDWSSMAKKLNELYPGNTSLANLLHNLNDTLQTGNDMVSTVSALQVLIPEYFSY